MYSRLELTVPGYVHLTPCSPCNFAKCDVLESSEIATNTAIVEEGNEATLPFLSPEPKREREKEVVHDQPLEALLGPSTINKRRQRKMKTKEQVYRCAVCGIVYTKEVNPIWLGCSHKETYMVRMLA